MPPSSVSPALILGAGANGLGAIRGLARRGVRVGIVGNGPEEPGLDSRYISHRYVLPDEGDRDEALRAILHQVEDGAVLIPTSDLFVDFLIRHRQDLERRFAFCLPSDELANLLIDKASETRRVAAAGVPIPATLQDLPPTADELIARLRLPIIIKPRRFDHMAILGRKNVVLPDRTAAEAFYRDYRGPLGVLLAQEVIPGPDDTLWVCNASFNRGGELAEGFTFQRLRLTPAHYGVTSYARSLFNPDVLALTAKLGRDLAYQGPAMVEFKFDRRDNQYKYIEINPRIGLCNLFDTECGINNVYNAYRLALGHTLEVRAGNRQQEGVIYIRLVDDLHSRWRDGESPSAILRHYASNLGKRHVFAIWSWRDPKPGLKLLAKDVRRVLGRL